MTDYPRSKWRLIRTQPSPGAWNMAVDEAILESSGNPGSLPTLRLYAWEPACLSLGHAQPIGDVDEESLAKLAWQLVRRPTGGRAILHTDELTYSVIGSESDPRLAGGVLTSYQNLAQALLRALELLGISAVAAEKPLTYAIHQSTGEEQEKKAQNPVCFEVPSNYEITWEAKKLIGSAQARRKGRVLQHGSFPLEGDLTRITRVLKYPGASARAQAANRLSARAVTAEQITNRKLSWEEAADKFQDAFEQTLNLELIPSQLTPAEIARAKSLMVEKYQSPEWTNRV